VGVELPWDQRTIAHRLHSSHTLGSAVGRHHRIEYQGVTIEFSKISPPLFFGFARIDHFYMATPEKAILDTFYLRKGLPTPDELDMETINVDTLKEMARKFPQTVSEGIVSLLS
jgi:hypothetical protein